MEIGMKIPWSKNGATIWPRYITLGICLKDPVSETHRCVFISTLLTIVNLATNLDVYREING